MAPRAAPRKAAARGSRVAAPCAQVKHDQTMAATAPVVGRGTPAIGAVVTANRTLLAAAAVGRGTATPGAPSGSGPASTMRRGSVGGGGFGRGRRGSQASIPEATPAPPPPAPPPTPPSASQAVRAATRERLASLLQSMSTAVASVKVPDAAALEAVAAITAGAAKARMARLYAAAASAEIVAPAAPVPALALPDVPPPPTAAAVGGVPTGRRTSRMLLSTAGSGGAATGQAAATARPRSAASGAANATSSGAASTPGTARGAAPTAAATQPVMASPAPAPPVPDTDRCPRRASWRRSRSRETAIVDAVARQALLSSLVLLSPPRTVDAGSRDGLAGNAHWAQHLRAYPCPAPHQQPCLACGGAGSCLMCGRIDVDAVELGAEGSDETDAAGRPTDAPQSDVVAGAGDDGIAEAAAAGAPSSFAPDDAEAAMQSLTLRRGLLSTLRAAAAPAPAAPQPSSAPSITMPADAASHMQPSPQCSAGPSLPHLAVPAVAHSGSTDPATPSHAAGRSSQRPRIVGPLRPVIAAGAGATASAAAADGSSWWVAGTAPAQPLHLPRAAAFAAGPGAGTRVRRLPPQGAESSVTGSAAAPSLSTPPRRRGPAPASHPLPQAMRGASALASDAIAAAKEAHDAVAAIREGYAALWSGEGRRVVAAPAGPPRRRVSPHLRHTEALARPQSGVAISHAHRALVAPAPSWSPDAVRGLPSSDRGGDRPDFHRPFGGRAAGSDGRGRTHRSDGSAGEGPTTSEGHDGIAQRHAGSRRNVSIGRAAVAAGSASARRPPSVHSESSHEASRAASHERKRDDRRHPSTSSHESDSSGDGAPGHSAVGRRLRPAPDSDSPTGHHGHDATSRSSGRYGRDGDVGDEAGDGGKVRWLRHSRHEHDAAAAAPELRQRRNAEPADGHGAAALALDLPDDADGHSDDDGEEGGEMLPLPETVTVHSLVGVIRDKLRTLLRKCGGDTALLDLSDRARESLYRSQLQAETDRERRIVERRLLERKAARVAAAVVGAHQRAASAQRQRQLRDAFPGGAATASRLHHDEEGSELESTAMEGAGAGAAPQPQASGKPGRGHHHATASARRQRYRVAVQAAAASDGARHAASPLRAQRWALRSTSAVGDAGSAVLSATLFDNVSHVLSARRSLGAQPADAMRDSVYAPAGAVERLAVIADAGGGDTAAGIRGRDAILAAAGYTDPLALTATSARAAAGSDIAPHPPSAAAGAGAGAGAGAAAVLLPVHIPAPRISDMTLAEREAEVLRLFARLVPSTPSAAAQ